MYRAADPGRGAADLHMAETYMETGAPYASCPHTACEPGTDGKMRALSSKLDARRHAGTDPEAEAEPERTRR